MNENLRMAFVFAFDFFAAIYIDDDDMLRADFFEPEAVGFHQDLVLARDTHGNMAEDVIPVAFIREDIAGVGKVLF
jgi:hypothetical protein